LTKELEPDLAALAPQETIERLRDYHFAPYITLAHIFNAPRGWGFDNRVLKQYALNYVLDGQGEFVVEGRSYHCAKGDIVLYRPYERHSIRTIEDRDFLSITVVFHFTDTQVPLEELFAGAHHFGNYANHAVSHRLAELVAKYHLPGLRNQLACQGLLLHILSELASRTAPETAPAASQSKTIARIVQIRNHLLANPQHELVPAELERMSGLSWNYIIARFKSTFDLTPHQFLIHARITKAKELALQSNLSFGEIAARVGYGDVHAFGKMFKKKTGMSLTQFCASVYEI